MEASPETDVPRGFGTGTLFAGNLRVPGSKSIAQRALVAAALCGGRTLLRALPEGRDVLAARRAVTALGAVAVPRGPGTLEVVGLTPERAAPGPPPGNLQARESGTLARLLTAALALRGAGAADSRLLGSGSLLHRRSPALFECLQRAGAAFQFDREAATWPVDVGPVDPPPDLLLDAPGSSQEVSAVLLALAAWPDVFRLRVRGPIPSRPYVDLTLAVLARFGVEAGVEGPPDAEVFWVRGPLRRPDGPLEVEPDASSAAVALAAGCLSGGEVHVEGIDPARSPQADARVDVLLRAFGCSTSAEDGGVTASGAPTRGVELDLSATPDLAPVAAALAAAAAMDGGGPSRLGLAGIPARFGDEWLAVGEPQEPADHPLVLDPRGDHRMAFAFALLSLVRPNLLVADPGCVAKSWPGFWEDLRMLAC